MELRVHTLAEDGQGENNISPAECGDKIAKVFTENNVYTNYTIKHYWANCVKEMHSPL